MLPVFTVKNLTWHDASDACQKMSADLVSFNTPEEYQFLQKHAPADTISWFWAGGYYHNTWQWVDGTTATNIQWYTGFPKHAPNDTDYRLAINNKTPERFTLYEALRTSEKPFICERPHLSA
ncbi:CD209 antigen-like protein D [Haliotis rubra]|uniref:CD209 antigen-like protein D n=1 Tax=Haliotis rubra TaxID=36100 RepID=UPI001EE5531E|nr:CD209 antigen-like protein D [Haliotis rubra]